VRDTWRVGRSLGRTVYRQTADEPSKFDEFLGIMETRELAAFVVHLVNTSDELIGEWVAEQEEIPPLLSEGES
jgi:hypothetical protein